MDINNLLSKGRPGSVSPERRDTPREGDQPSQSTSTGRGTWEPGRHATIHESDTSPRGYAMELARQGWNPPREWQVSSSSDQQVHQWPQQLGSRVITSDFAHSPVPIQWDTSREEAYGNENEISLIRRNDISNAMSSSTKFTQVRNFLTSKAEGRSGSKQYADAKKNNQAFTNAWRYYVENGDASTKEKMRCIIQAVRLRANKQNIGDPRQERQAPSSSDQQVQQRPQPFDSGIVTSEFARSPVPIQRDTQKHRISDAPFPASHRIRTESGEQSSHADRLRETIAEMRAILHPAGEPSLDQASQQSMRVQEQFPLLASEQEIAPLTHKKRPESCSVNLTKDEIVSIQTNTISKGQNRIQMEIKRINEKKVQSSKDAIKLQVLTKANKDFYAIKTHIEIKNKNGANDIWTNLKNNADTHPSIRSALETIVKLNEHLKNSRTSPD